MVLHISRIVKVIESNFAEGHLINVSDAAEGCCVHRNCRNFITICEDTIKLELVSSNDEEWDGKGDHADHEEDCKIDNIGDHAYHGLDHGWHLLVKLKEVKSFEQNEKRVDCTQSSQSSEAPDSLRAIAEYQIWTDDSNERVGSVADGPFCV